MSEKPRRWFRFSLRTLFALYAVVGIVSALAIVVRDRWVDVAFPVTTFLMFLALATPVLAVTALMVGGLFLLLFYPYRHRHVERDSRAKRP